MFSYISKIFWWHCSIRTALCLGGCLDLFSFAEQKDLLKNLVVHEENCRLKMDLGDFYH